MIRALVTGSLYGPPQARTSQPDKPLRVYPVDGGYRLIDGNHRLEAAIKLALNVIPALIVEKPADELAEIQQARESNEASETVVPTTFVDDAELVWRLTETFTQEQTAKAMGWSRAQVSQYAMLNKINDEAWRIVATSFYGTVASEDDDEVADYATTVATPFSERLLRNILDLDPGQQVELCGYLAKGKDGASVWCSIIAFGDVADRLMTLGNGAALAVSGKAEINGWLDKQGEPKAGLSLVADDVATLKAKPKPQSQEQGEPAPRRTPRRPVATAPGFDDALPDCFS